MGIISNLLGFEVRQPLVVILQADLQHPHTASHAGEFVMTCPAHTNQPLTQTQGSTEEQGPSDRLREPGKQWATRPWEKQSVEIATPQGNMHSIRDWHLKNIRETRKITFAVRGIMRGPWGSEKTKGSRARKKTEGLIGSNNQSNSSGYTLKCCGT